MPRGPAWKASDLARAAQALRTGVRLDDVVASVHPRTRNAFLIEMRRTGHAVKALCREGQRARVRAILDAGGGASEVMASEDLMRETAIRLISAVLAVGDRRKGLRVTTQAEERAIYLSTREYGYTETARRFGRAMTTVRRAANRYRSEVLPESEPIRGAPRVRRAATRATEPSP